MCPWRLLSKKGAGLRLAQQSPFLVAVTIVAIVGSVMWLSAPADHDHAQHGNDTHSIAVPTLSSSAKQGEALFNANCVACHGKNAGGTQSGPPLVHKIYEPGHHSDLSFQRAAKLGVRAHHWPFGNMPPVPGVNESDVTQIIAYVRELQRANGIR